MNDSPFLPGASVAAYLRDSGGDAQDLSILQQENQIRAWCLAHDLHLTTLFIDEAQSGSSTVGRTGFIQMIDYFSDSGRPELGVILWKLSRFSREIDDAQFYKSSLRRKGYLLHSLQDNIPAGPEGRVFETMIEWMNARFLKDLSEDIKRGLKHNLDAYSAIGGKPPRGFRHGPAIKVGMRRDGRPHEVRTWEPDPDLVPLVQKAFQMRANGASIKTIVQETRLYKTANSMHHFFHNEIYIGRLRFGGKVIDTYCEPMIDMETWEVVQRMKILPNPLPFTSELERTKHHPRTVNSDYLLTGKLVCMECGGPMVGKTSYNKNRAVRNRYYMCTTKKKSYGVDCQASLVPKEFTELMILNEITKHIITVDNLLHLRDDMQSRHNKDVQEKRSLLKRLEADKSDNQKALKNLLDAMERGGYLDVIDERIREKRSIATDLNSRIHKIKHDIENLTHLPSEDQIQDLAGKLSKYFETANPSEVKTLLQHLVEHIEIKKEDTITIAKIFYYFPEDVVSMDVCPRRETIYRYDVLIFYGFVPFSLLDSRWKANFKEENEVILI